MLFVLLIDLLFIYLFIFPRNPGYPEDVLKGGGTQN